MNPYFRLMRLHQPIGIWLLLWPCWWSIALASRGFPSLWLLFLFALGAVVMRGAGCIVNDLWDRKFDAKVERTKSRPLASGEVTPQQAFILLGALLLLALAIAALLGWTVVKWAMASLPLIVAYPLMKRITWWPQLFLGLTFNWGALMGWVAVQGELGAPAVLLYLAGIGWTLGYDTIYAHQDKMDDLLIGVKSTALRLGYNTRFWVTGFYAWMMACLGLIAYLQPFNWLYFAGMLGACAHLTWQVLSVDLDEPASCRKIFVSNAWFGALIFLSIALGKTA